MDQIYAKEKNLISKNLINDILLYVANKIVDNPLQDEKNSLNFCEKRETPEEGFLNVNEGEPEFS